MADAIMLSEFPEQKQRYKICMEQWENNMSEFKGFGDWIEIFRGGKQIDSTGREHDGDALISKAVASFDPSYHEPPIVVGHPKDNAPAFGWVQGLKQSGSRLLAKIRDVVPEFEAIAKQGLYKKRSASFYPDGRLRHVGFLGAAPPAVKGLADLKFDDGEAMVTFEFSASKEDKAAQRARSKKYGIAVKEGGHVTRPGQWTNVPDDQFLDPVNYRYPCPDADQTRAAASYWGRADNRTQYTPEERSIINERLDKFRKKFKIGEYRKEAKMDFKELIEFFKFWKKAEEDPDLDIPDFLKSKPTGNEKVSSFTEADIENAKKEAAEAEREKITVEFAEKERTAARDARNEEITTWCEGLVTAGKIAPAWVKAGLPQVFEFLAASDDVIEFGEEKKKSSHYDWLKDFFENQMPKLITFKEIANRDIDAGEGGAGQKMEALIKKKMESSEKLDYNAAFSEVQRENPELANEYVAELQGK